MPLPPKAFKLVNAVTVPALMVNPPVKLLPMLSVSVPTPVLVTPPLPEITPLMVVSPLPLTVCVPPVVSMVRLIVCKLLLLLMMGIGIIWVPERVKVLAPLSNVIELNTVPVG